MRIQDKAHREAILRCPCVVCYLLKLTQASITECHHLKHLPDGTRLYRGHKKADDTYTIPLCQKTHHWNGVHVNMSLAEFESIAGDEPYLWHVTETEILPIYGDDW